MKSLKLILSFACFFILKNGVAQELTESEVMIKQFNRTINNPESPDTAKGNAYLHLAEFLYLTNLDTIIPLCEKAKKISEKGLLKPNISSEERIAFRNIIASCHNNIGYAHMRRNRLDKASESYNAGLKIQIENKEYEGMAISLNNLGQIYDRKGDIQKALNYYQQSKMIQEETGDKRGLAISLNNIAIIYKNQGNSAKALEYYNESYDLREEMDNKYGMAISLNNIGTLYHDQGESEVALMYYQKSYDLREEIGDRRGMSHALHNIGGVYREIGELKSAMEVFKESLLLREELDLADEIAESKVDIGNIYLRQGYLDAAAKLGEDALEAYQELGYPDEIRTASELLAQVYEQQRKGMKALEMLKLTEAMEDSLENAELQRAIVTQEASYTYEKQRAIDKINAEKKRIVDEEEKQKQQIITYATVGGLILLAAFLAFVFNRLRITRRQRNEIGAQKREIEEKSQEILDSITYAKRIQSAILPSNENLIKGLGKGFVFYQPKDIVAGDFYWLQLQENRTLFAVADCTGHGVPGAMVSVVCNNGLNRAVREYGLSDPGQILDKTREIVIQEFDENSGEVKDGMDIALCSIEGKKLKYAGAHNPLWIIRNNELLETKADKEPIGKFDKQTPYQTHEFDILDGDTIYIFSDGFADQFGGPAGKKFRPKAFKDLLISIHHLDMDEQKIKIENAFLDWKGDHPQLDDICVIGVQL